jgi:outer membrane biogenesis lipoprotein LolB
MENKIRKLNHILLAVMALLMLTACAGLEPTSTELTSELRFVLTLTM